MKQCPKCKTENPEVANFCRNCRYKFPEATKNGKSVSPLIFSFDVLEDSYTIGSLIHFEWKVENANIIKLNEYDVTSNVTAEMIVEKAESVTLTAENDYDKAVRTIRLSPRPFPSIRFFSASSQFIGDGQEVKLKWDFRDTTKAILAFSGGQLNVTNKTFIKLSPKATEEFQLRCYSCDERLFEEQSITVKVIHPVTVQKFYADKDVVVESDKVTLRWNVENADSIMIEPIMKDVTRLTSLQVSPARTTEYRLVASNLISRAEASLSVGVRTLPKIDINLGDTFAKMELPSCNVDLSFLSDSIKEADVDVWMTTAPSKAIEKHIWKEKILRKWKEIASIFGKPKH